jgi:hypothetical protein
MHLYEHLQVQNFKSPFKRQFVILVIILTYEWCTSCIITFPKNIIIIFLSFMDGVDHFQTFMDITDHFQSPMDYINDLYSLNKVDLFWVRHG